MIDERWIGKFLEGRRRGPIEVLSQQLPGGNEENYENSRTKHPVPRPKLKPSTSRVEIYSVTSSWVCSVVTNGAITEISFNRELSFHLVAYWSYDVPQKYSRAYGDYIRRGLDWQLDLLDSKSVTLTKSLRTLDSHWQPSISELSLLQLQLSLLWTLSRRLTDYFLKTNSSVAPDPGFSLQQPTSHGSSRACRLSTTALPVVS
jgi:hypothetical protein